MALLIDRPAWPAHGRLWSHLVSDTSYDELHRFAARVGLPRRSYEGDHYDVPAERYGAVVAAGARAVDGREVVQALQRSGLRLPKRKGERVLDTWADAGWLAGEPPHRVDCLASPMPPPSMVGTVRLVVDGDALLVLHDDLPPWTPAGGDQPCGYLRARFERPARRVHRAAVVPVRTGAAASPAVGERWRSVAELVAAPPASALRFWLPLVVHRQRAGRT